MDLIAALLATLAAGLFAGAAVAVYIAFVEHPARAGLSASPGCRRGSRFASARGRSHGSKSLDRDARTGTGHTPDTLPTPRWLSALSSHRHRDYGRR